MTWHGVKECCTQSSQLLRIRSLVSPSCRGDARQKSRNEWSGERGSFKCSLLEASREAQVIHKVLMASILKECQLFRSSHMRRKRHRWWILPCLCNGSSLHASQDHGGSWEYGQRWSLGLTLGMSWVGHTIPHRVTGWFLDWDEWKQPGSTQSKGKVYLAWFVFLSWDLWPRLSQTMWTFWKRKQTGTSRVQFGSLPAGHSACGAWGHLDSARLCPHGPRLMPSEGR